MTRQEEMRVVQELKNQFDSATDAMERAKLFIDIVVHDTNAANLLGVYEQELYSDHMKLTFFSPYKIENGKPVLDVEKRNANMNALASIYEEGLIKKGKFIKETYEKFKEQNGERKTPDGVDINYELAKKEAAYADVNCVPTAFSTALRMFATDEEIEDAVNQITGETNDGYLLDVTQEYLNPLDHLDKYSEEEKEYLKTGLEGIRESLVKPLYPKERENELIDEAIEKYSKSAFGRKLWGTIENDLDYEARKNRTHVGEAVKRIWDYAQKNKVSEEFNDLANICDVAYDAENNLDNYKSFYENVGEAYDKLCDFAKYKGNNPDRLNEVNVVKSAIEGLEKNLAKITLKNGYYVSENEAAFRAKLIKEKYDKASLTDKARLVLEFNLNAHKLEEAFTPEQKAVYQEMVADFFAPGKEENGVKVYDKEQLRKNMDAYNKVLFESKIQVGKEVEELRNKFEENYGPYIIEKNGKTYDGNLEAARFCVDKNSHSAASIMANVSSMMMFTFGGYGSYFPDYYDDETLKDIIDETRNALKEDTTLFSEEDRKYIGLFEHEISDELSVADELYNDPDTSEIGARNEARDYHLYADNEVGKLLFGDTQFKHENIEIDDAYFKARNNEDLAKAINNMKANVRETKNSDLYQKIISAYKATIEVDDLEVAAIGMKAINDACEDYIQNRNPFTAQGKERLRLVQEVQRAVQLPLQKMEQALNREPQILYRNVDEEKVYQRAIEKAKARDLAAAEKAIENQAAAPTAQPETAPAQAEVETPGEEALPTQAEVEAPEEALPTQAEVEAPEAETPEEALPTQAEVEAPEAETPEEALPTQAEVEAPEVETPEEAASAQAAAPVAQPQTVTPVETPEQKTARMNKGVLALANLQNSLKALKTDAWYHRNTKEYNDLVKATEDLEKAFSGALDKNEDKINEEDKKVLKEAIEKMGKLSMDYISEKNGTKAGKPEKEPSSELGKARYNAAQNLQSSVFALNDYADSIPVEKTASNERSNNTREKTSFAELASEQGGKDVGTTDKSKSKTKTKSAELK